MGCINSRNNNINRRLREFKCLVREFLENNEDVLESYVAIREWIDKNAECYAPNANSCECERLNRDVEKILKGITRELLEALNDLNKAIKALENAQCLQAKLDRAFLKYVECVHEEDSSCEC